MDTGRHGPNLLKRHKKGREHEGSRGSFPSYINIKIPAEILKRRRCNK